MSMWKKCSLHKVAEIERDSIEASAITDGTLYVGLENIESGGSFVNVRSVANGELASNKFTFTERHVLYGKLRPYLAKIARPSFDGICSTDILPILPGPELDRDYLTHFLRQPTMIDLANSRAAGANLPRLSPKALAGFEIPFPPLAEQRRLAAILDQTEALRAKRRHALAQLDNLTQSLFLDLFGDFQANSRHWPVKKLGELCEAAIDCPHSTPVYATRLTPHPCVRSSDIQGATLDFTATKYVEPEEYQKRIARGRPRAGDVIYCREGARFGNAARVTDDTQLCLGQRMMLLRCRVDKATTEFLWAFLSSRVAYRQATRALDGSASPHVNIRDIVAFRVPVPPLSLQHEFAAQVSAVERLKTAQRASLAKLDVLFASLQHRAFRGEL